jgi:hypothetical protein
MEFIFLQPILAVLNEFQQAFRLDLQEQNEFCWMTILQCSGLGFYTREAVVVQAGTHDVDHLQYRPDSRSSQGLEATSEWLHQNNTQLSRALLCYNERLLYQLMPDVHLDCIHTHM